MPLGEFDAAEGWRIIEGMRGGCYCDLSLADRLVVAVATSFQDNNLPPERTRRGKYLALLVFVGDVACIAGRKAIVVA